MAEIETSEVQAEETEGAQVETERAFEIAETPEVKAALKRANDQAAALRLELKAAKADQARLKELEDRDKTEAQRLQEERDTAVAERDILRSQTLRREVADEKGLTPAQAKRLVGTTREEMEADADSILTDFPVTPAKAAFTDVGQGVRQGANANATVYRQSQLNDHEFFAAHKADILAAWAEGGSRIIPD